MKLLRAVGPLLLVLPCAGCGGEGEGGSRALYELERMTFVPAAPCHIDGYSGPLSDCTLEHAILIDVYEVTRRDWLHYTPEPAAGDLRSLPFSAELAGFDKGKLDWPVFLSSADALRLAEQRRMRLPTAAEWIHVAIGRRSQGYPWGYRPWRSVANTLELGLGTPCPVGTFENGKSQPFGCYDMVGNVWEWVADRVPGSSPFEDEFPVHPGIEDGLVSVLGGAYDSHLRRTFGSADPYVATTVRFHARTVDRRVVSPAIGVRMCADAGEYLWLRADDWGGDAGARLRLEALGARWARVSGRDYVLPFLEELAAREAAPPGLAWLAEGARARP